MDDDTGLPEPDCLARLAGRVEPDLGFWDRWWPNRTPSAWSLLIRLPVE